MFNKSSRRPFQAMKANDQVTHTGQSWAEDDPRSARFMVKAKQTNTRWAIDLIAQVPPIIVNKRVVACQGDPNPALGHPKVFINVDAHEPVACIYCGLRYQLSNDHHH
jgi:NADH dehydrogenase (ubiquinone) Fe-S protein 6